MGLPATYVQATMDLLMEDHLKTTRASQIFAVTGSPDVSLIKLKRKNGNGPLYRVELLGLDVFDPVTMQNDHRKGDDVPEPVRPHAKDCRSPRCGTAYQMPEVRGADRLGPCQFPGTVSLSGMP